MVELEQLFSDSLCALCPSYRLLGMFAMSVCVTVCTFFIPSTLGVVLFSMAMGFLLSLDLSQFGTYCGGGSRGACGDSGWRRGASPAPPSRFGWRLGCSELLLYLGLLLGAMTEAGLLHHFLSPSQNFARGSQDAVSYLLITLFIVCWALREIQGAYVFGGVFLNPLYPRGMANVRVFKQRSRGLHVAGAIRRVLLNLGELTLQYSIALSLLKHTIHAS